MSLQDEVAATPGGQALASQIAMLDVQPVALSDTAAGLRTTGTDAGEATAAVQSSVAALDGAWQGESADAFVGYMNDFNSAGIQLAEATEGVAGALDALADALTGAKASVQSKGENFLSEARRVREQLRDMPPDQVDAQIAAVGAEYAAAAQEDIAAANDAMGTALGAIGQHGGNLSALFTALPEPGAQPFTPAPGNPVDWVPAPDPGEAQPAPVSTAPQFEGGGDGSSSGGGSSGGFSGGGSGSGGGDFGSGAGGGLGSSGGPPAGSPPGNVDQWIREAIKILQENGIPVTEDNIDEIWTIIEKESGGDPNAINNWDSNAAKGTPSKGLMQTIDPTFDAHALPGHTDIWNPVDNIIAGVRYTFDRYGGFDNHPGLASMASGGGYQGY